MTITGGHFSDSPTDNPVQYDPEFVQGYDRNCYVKTTQDDQIVCRMAKDYTRANGIAEIIVFASTYEEATYEDGVSKMFTFLRSDEIPTITGYTVEFTSEHKYKLTIEGTDITDSSADTVDVVIGGFEQQILSVSSTQVEVQLTTLTRGGGINSFEVYFVEGIPNGWSESEGGDFETGISFDPKLVQLSVSEGSSAGGTIYAIAEGAGIEDSLTLSDGNTFCESSEMIAYSLLRCVTTAKEISSATGLAVRDTISDESFACANSADTTKC